ncbi:MAG: ferrous iron transporter B [Enterocloster asparagiformis]|nr:ferrous iron transporter B [Enterocloster asparagiformis]
MKDGRTLIALTGCPNTGKTTIFNGLTGRNTPTGNWAGTTVEPAVGTYMYSGCTYLMADIPGSDSLSAGGQWETLPRDFLRSGLADAVLVVCSASALERGLSYLDRLLRLERVRQTGLPVVLCLNLWDEAKKRSISIDLDLLSDVLQIPVVPCCARCREDLDDVKTALHYACTPAQRSRFRYECLDFSPKRLADACCGRRPSAPRVSLPFDRVVTDPLYGKLFLFFLMTALFWAAMACSAPVSGLLRRGLEGLGAPFNAFLSWSHTPPWLVSCLVRAIGLPLAWTLPLMLPPMAIFFPLLALAGESGLLPRAAFAMDRCLERCRACGRQCMSMAVGMGCSAAGVLNCRPIASPGQRLTAVVTASFIPCSGKFPLLAALALLFFTGFPAWGLPDGLFRALLLSGAFTAALGANLALSRLLSNALAGGRPPAFILELPEFRRPRFGRVIRDSLFSRVVLVMGRMAAVVLPAGMLIWISARIFCPGPSGGWFTLAPSAPSLLDAFIRLFDPMGRLMGLDGVILAAFLIGLPANEAVFPLILMIYLQSGPSVPAGSLGQFLALHGWTWRTALCLMALCVFHWPCLTTCRIIRRETGSLLWTAAAVLLPALAGLLVCACLNLVLTMTP